MLTLATFGDWLNGAWQGILIGIIGMTVLYAGFGMLKKPKAWWK